MAKKPLQRQIMMALAVGGVLASLLAGQVGAFYFPKLAVQNLASASELSSETPVLSSYWSGKILRWETLIVQEANRRSLDPDFVASLVWRESRGDPNAIGPGGSVGLMQIMPKESGFSWRPSKEVLLDPAANLFWGTRTLSIIIQQGNGDVFNALAAYNGGWEQTDYRRPRTFATTILRDYAYALASRCGTTGRWIAFFAIESSHTHGPIWVADSARSDVYYFGQTNTLPDGTPLIPDAPPTSVVAHFTSAETGAPRSVGVWLYNVTQNTWDGCSATRQVTAALLPTATSAVTPTPRFPATPTATAPVPTETPGASTVPPASIALPSPTPTFIPVMPPRPGGELAAAPEAVVLNEGAELRPGATLWWYPTDTLQAGMKVRLLGYDPEMPDWVYIGSTDGRVLGWTQMANLRLPASAYGLKLVTPIPTLTPSPTPTLTPTATPTVACPGGPFRAEAWPMDKYRSPEGGWIAVIYARGYGGTCEYTYKWEGEVVEGPTFGCVTFKLHQDRFATLVGTMTVISGEEEVSVGIYIESP